MKKLFLLALSTLMIAGCIKGKWRDNIKISDDNIVFSVDGGEQRIYSTIGAGFTLQDMPYIGEEDNYKIIEGKNPADHIGYEISWIKVMFDDLQGRTSLMITAKPNTTGKERGCTFNIGSGDFCKRINIVQKAN